ncbi:MAG: glycosyltransferase [Candidatus Cryptobacteroides sp.]|nr:glycosyltransferase [Candidatus Cryptobacteroides sp.]
MSNPKISVIIPVYNAESTLRRCVDSVLVQTFTDFECLLIDDGSKDRSGEICDEYARKDSRVKVFHKENGGVSSARNVGLDNARGEWITFVDSDDWIDVHSIMNYQIAVDNDVDMVIQGYVIENASSENSYFGIDYTGTVSDVITHLDKDNYLGFVWNKLFNHNLLVTSSLKFDETMSFQEDFLYSLDYMTLCRRIRSISFSGYHYYMPDWGQKYNLPHGVNYYQRVFEDILKLTGDSSCPICVRSQEDYLQRILISVRDIEKGCRKNLSRYRKLVGKSIFYTKLFWLTKVFIYVDFSSYVSIAVIFLHMQLRNFFIRYGR